MDTAKTVSIGRYCIYNLLINVNIIILFSPFKGRESYRDLNEHIRSTKHRNFAQNEENFKELQAFACSLYGNRSRRKKSRVMKEKKNKNWKTENENVHFCGKMDVQRVDENFVPRMERPKKHLPLLINETKTKHSEERITLPGKGQPHA